MNEERYIRQQMAGKQPFRVPEGYFDDFRTRIMERLPEAVSPCETMEQEAATHVVRRRPLRLWWAAAACLAALVVCTSLYFRGEEHRRVYDVPTAESANDQFVDALADYCMVDNADIYACLEDY